MSFPDCNNTRIGLILLLANGIQIVLVFSAQSIMSNYLQNFDFLTEFKICV